MSIEDNKNIVHRFFQEGPSKGDLRAADELLAANFAPHIPLPSAPGIKGMNDVITACRSAFEHLNVTIEDMGQRKTKSLHASQLAAYAKALSWI